MKVIYSILSAASGKLGGVVASHNRSGQYLRKHSVPTQPRTAAQTIVRGQLRAISSSFRSLTSDQVAAWNALGATVTLKNKLGTSFHPTGQQLYVSCNKNLQLIGITTLLSDAPSVPTLPSITTFSITPHSTANVVDGFTIAVTSGDLTGYALILRASSVQSTGRTFLGKSAFRTLAGYNPASGLPTLINSLYTDKFGPLPGNGYVGMELKIVDPSSGFASSAVKATCDFASTAASGLFTASIGAQVGVTTAGSGTPHFVVSSAAIGSFNGSLTYSVSGLPAACSWAPTPANPEAVGTAETITITAASAAAGSYPITVKVSYGAASVTLNATLVIA